MFTHNRTQSSLCYLAHRFTILLHINNGFLWIDDPKVHNRTHFHRNVIAADNVLAGHIHYHCAQIHFLYRLQKRHHKHQAGPFYRLKPPQQKHHTALVLTKDADGINHQQEHEHCQQAHHIFKNHKSSNGSLLRPWNYNLRRAISKSPSCSTTSTVSPSLTGSSLTAFQNSPSILILKPSSVSWLTCPRRPTMA